MEIQNYLKAAYWLNNSKNIALVDGKFIKLGLFTSVSKKQQEIATISAFLLNQETTHATKEDKEAFTALSNAFIKRYASSKKEPGKIVNLLDLKLVQSGLTTSYANPKNQAAFTKWCRNELPSEIFKKYPEFSAYLEKVRLLSQIKVTRDTIIEQDNEPCILVEGKQTKFSELKEKFELEFAPRFNESFVVNKETRDVYTYLDNGKGLQKHHPYMTELTPISNVDDAEYQKILAKAHEFVREGEENTSAQERKELASKRPFIIQIVSSFVHGTDTNANNLIQRSKHPYLRVIAGQDNPELYTKKGDVFEVGYGWQRKILAPFIASQGQFRSPDLWEYMPANERIVTNIAVSKEEAHNLFSFTRKYHRDQVNLGVNVGFHLATQNCSVYVRKALQSAGINAPTEISVPQLLLKISPEWMKATGRALGKIKFCISERLRKGLGALCSKIAQVSTRSFLFISNCLMYPIRLIAAKFYGDGGVAFNPQGNGPAKIVTHTPYKYNLPGILQEWQRKQASTVIYKKPVKLAIVP